MIQRMSAGSIATERLPHEIPDWIGRRACRELRAEVGLAFGDGCAHHDLDHREQITFAPFGLGTLRQDSLNGCPAQAFGGTFRLTQVMSISRR